MSMHLGNESVEVSLPPSCSITIGSSVESNPPTGDLEQLSEEEAPSSSSSSLSSSDKKKKSQKKKLVVLAFLLIAALVATAIGVGVGSSSNSSANKSTSTAALGDFVTYDASSSSSSKSAKSGTSKSSYSGSAKSGKSLTKSPTEGPTADPTLAPITGTPTEGLTADPTRSPTSFCPVGSTDEGEECRTSLPDNFNGGCYDVGVNSGFSNITFGESVCGTVSNYVDNEVGSLRDTDWYKVEVSEDTTVSVRLTTDFSAFLFLDRLGDVNPCGELKYIVSGTDIGDNTYVLSRSVTAGDYTVRVTSASAGDSPLSCPTPGNYTLTVIDGPVP